LIEGTMLVGLHTTWSALQAKNPSYAPGSLICCGFVQQAVQQITADLSTIM